MVDFKKLSEKRKNEDYDPFAPAPIPEELLSGAGKDVIDTLLKDNKDVFLTGGGGVGKSYLVNKIKQHPEIRPITLASTAVAANLVGGMTVHRFFGLGISKNVAELKKKDKRTAEWFADKIGESTQRAHSILMNKMKKNLYGINLIIIDEVSMLSSAAINMIYYRLYKSLKWDTDIRFLFVGDFFQLPPVDIKGNLKLAFEAEQWNVKNIELTEIKRTENLEFAKIQHRIRYGDSSDEVVSYVEKLGDNEYKEDTLHLFATNKEIDAHNIEKLRALPGDPKKVKFQFNEHLYKEEDAKKFIDDYLLINDTFYFKFGARVLFTNNAYEETGEMIWYNGEMGTLKSYEKGAFRVLKDDGVEVDVPRVTFEQEEYINGKPEIVMAVRHFPLRIAYAISIHKSQGLSLPRGHIDCSQFFLNEQFFVAISRFTDPKNLSIVGFRKSLIKPNERAMEYYGKNEIIKY